MPREISLHPLNFWSSACVIMGIVLAMTIFVGVYDTVWAESEQQTCVSSAPRGNSYSVDVCIDQPSDGSAINEVAQVTVSVTTTGINPGTAKVRAYLDGQYLLIDYQAPYAFDISAAHVAIGTHVLSLEAIMRDGFTTDQVSINLNFQQGGAPPIDQYVPPFVPSPPAAGTSLVVAAAGDAASGENNASSVSDLLTAWQPNMFLYLGDVYEKGTHTEFFNWYGTTSRLFGRMRTVTNPVIGNHEYENKLAPGYFDYWNQVPDYYSYDAAGWHFIALNSTSQLGEREPGSAQYAWLAQDLVQNASQKCTVVYFHHPVLSIGPQGDSSELFSLWNLMANSGVDLVITGHDHGYQRWQPLDGGLQPSPDGTTQFVVGAGGHGIQAFVRTDPRFVVGYDTSPFAFGALRLQLNPNGAEYRYVNIDSQILDDGVIPCSGAGTDTISPTLVPNYNAGLDSDGRVVVSWSPSYDDTGVAAYTIYRDGAALVTVSGSTLQYVDISAALNSTYNYTVEAVDLAGNRSPQPTPITVSTSTQVTLTFGPKVDTFVAANFPSSNYGQKNYLRTDASPDVRSLLRFDVQGINGYVTSATLRVYANSGSGTGYRLHKISDNTWSETGTTYANMPALGDYVASSGPFVAGSWIEIDVTSAVALNNLYSYGLITLSNTAISLGSRESSTSPQLIVTVDTSVPPPPPPGTVVFNPTADAYVSSAAPTTNYGGVSKLRTDASPVINSYLHFDVTNIAPYVEQATLRIYANSGSSTGYRLSATDSGWSEVGITYSNAPAIGYLLSTSGPFSAGSWTEIDVTQWIGGEGQFDFALNSTSNTAISYSSREGANAPELVLVTSDTPPPPPPAGTFTFAPIGDAYVAANNPNRNYGSSSQLRADASPDVRSYLRFNVQGLAGDISQATLKIYARSGSSTGYSVHVPSADGWTELGITYANAPAMNQPAIGNSGSFAKRDWTLVDVTSLITGDGLVEFGLTTTNNTALSLASREDDTNPPELIVETIEAASAAGSPALPTVFPAEQYSLWRNDKGLIASDDDHLIDADQDGLPDVEEYLNGTDPLNSDSDGDGLPDLWEVEGGLDSD